jgi:alkylhydroperoxidase family enzyme
MTWIRTTSVPEASGELKAIYDAAVQRAGRVYKILEAMSPDPRVLQASLGMYQAIMFAPVGLARAEREMLAVVTSRSNRCHY